MRSWTLVVRSAATPRVSNHEATVVLSWIRISNSGHPSQTHPRDLAAYPREFCQKIPALSHRRAQGMPGAWCARSRAWCVESTRVSHHGHTGNTRHSPRNGFNGFLRALPGDRACLSPSLARRVRPVRADIAIRKLDAGVEASGPHDFAVRCRAVRLSAHQRPPHPALNVRDDRETPLSEAGRQGICD
jgi:hypothetical protein